MLTLFFAGLLSTSHAQDSSLSGKVVSAEDRQPLRGVTVHIADLSIQQITDANGSFLFQNLPPGRYTLNFSYLGFEPLRTDISLPLSTGDAMTIQLKPQEALHFGDFGGLPLKVLYALLGLTSGFLSISGFVVFLFRRKKKQRLSGNPWKTIVAYSLLTILFLAIIAFISMNIGYGTASMIAEVLINGVLIGLIVYVLARYALKKFRRRQQLI